MRKIRGSGFSMPTLPLSTLGDLAPQVSDFVDRPRGVEERRQLPGVEARARRHRADHLAPAQRARPLAKRPGDVDEPAALRERLRLALGPHEIAGEHLVTRLDDELREPRVVQEDDGVSSVEAEQVDVPNELARDASCAFAHPRSFAVGT
jgi:hypothetical protein